MDTTSVVALVVALGGWVLAAVTTWINYRTQTEATFYQALDWLSGGTQKRSIGIAAIEGSWRRARFRRLSLPLLCSSSVYLLLSSNQRDSPQELTNLRRMMALVTNVTRVPPDYRLHYQLLLEALNEKGAKSDISLGLDIAEEQVREWRHKVAALTGQPLTPSPS